MTCSFSIAHSFHNRLTSSLALPPLFLLLVFSPPFYPTSLFFMSYIFPLHFLFPFLSQDLTHIINTPTYTR